MKMETFGFNEIVTFVQIVKWYIFALQTAKLFEFRLSL